MANRNIIGPSNEFKSSLNRFKDNEVAKSTPDGFTTSKREAEKCPYSTDSEEAVPLSKSK